MSGSDFGRVGELASVLTRPRRDIVLEYAHSTYEEFEKGLNVASAADKRAQSAGFTTLDQELAGLPADIFRITTDEGKTSNWSYRQRLSVLIPRHELPVRDYEQFFAP